jgi:hypothetical protein
MFRPSGKDLSGGRGLRFGSKKKASNAGLAVILAQFDDYSKKSLYAVADVPVLG